MQVLNTELVRGSPRALAAFLFLPLAHVQPCVDLGTGHPAAGSVVAAMEESTGEEWNWSVADALMVTVTEERDPPHAWGDTSAWSPDAGQDDTLGCLL